MNTVKLMKIPQENIYAEKNIKLERVEEIYNHVTKLIRARTKSLTINTGIFGTEWYQWGFQWDKIKHHALKEGAL